MGRREKKIGCPAELTLRVIEGRWKISILSELFKGTKRPTQLQKSLLGITHKVLAQQLKQMEKEGLIFRTPYREVPPKVEYSLSSTGRSLHAVLDAMDEWGRKHRQIVSEVFERRTGIPGNI
jgi:DNA-binding HxlR family transcriptional regulator